MRREFREVLRTLARGAERGTRPRIPALSGREEESLLGRFQSNCLRASIPVRKDPESGLARDADPARETCDPSSGSVELFRGVEVSFLRAWAEVPDDLPDHVRSWSQADGGVAPQARRYRFREDGDSCSSRQRAQRPLRRLVTYAAREFARLLPSLPSQRRMAVSESNGQVSGPFDRSPARVPTSGTGIRTSQTGDDSYFETQLRHESARDGSRSQNHSSSAGTCEPEHDGPLPSCGGGSQAGSQ